MNFIFDLGGVVLRWHPPSLLARALPERAAKRAATEALALKFFHEGSDWPDFDRGSVDVPALVERIAARTGLNCSEVQRVVDAVPGELQPMAETVALLEVLRRAGHRLYYLSNMPAPYAARLVREHVFFSWFEAGVFSSQVGMLKPEPAIFQHALREFRIAAQGTVYFDDHAPNVEAASALGLHALLFVDAAHARAQLQALDAPAGML